MRVQPFDNNHFPPLQAFLRRFYPAAPVKADERYWRWKFEGNPAAPSSGGYFVAVDEDRVVGQVGAIGDRLWANGEWHPFVWLADFAVDPEHRRSHVGLRLLQAMMASHRLIMIVGTSTVLYEIYRALGWIRQPVAETFYSLVRPSRLVALAEQRNKPQETGEWGRLSSLRRLLPLADGGMRALHFAHGAWQTVRRHGLMVERLAQFDSETDDLARRVLPKLGVTCYRDAAQLNWRFGSRPVGNHYTLAARDPRTRALRGYLAMRLLARGPARWAAVADVLTDPDDGRTLDALLSAAHDRAVGEGADFLRFWCSLPAHARRLHRPFWIRHTRHIVDDLLMWSRDSSLLETLRREKWHLTAMASDRIDDGSGEIQDCEEALVRGAGA